MGIPPSQSDQEEIKKLIAEAKKLFPMNETVRLLEADAMCQEGNLDEALDRCDNIINSAADRADAIPYVIKANIMAQKVFITFIFVGL
jgi:cytochrome c-type biogenesis protein CcmH/NrfG